MTFNKSKLAFCNFRTIFTLINHAKYIPIMKKVLLIATAALLVTGVSFADGGKKKKCSKSKSCCSGTSKSCCKDKSKTATM